MAPQQPRTNNRSGTLIEGRSLLLIAGVFFLFPNFIVQVRDNRSSANCLNPLLWVGIWVFAGLTLVRAFFLSDIPLMSALRDMAPLLYFCFVPILAYAFVGRSTLFLWFTRITTLAHVSLAAAFQVGLLDGAQSQLLRSSDIQLGSYRSDLIGISAGVGVVVWGKWKNLKANSWLQAIILVLGSLLVGSRSAALAIAVGTLIALIRIFKGRNIRNHITVAAAAFASLMLLTLPIVVSWGDSMSGDNATLSNERVRSGDSPSVPGNSLALEEPMIRPIPNAGVSQDLGTIGARVMTWDAVLTFLIRNPLELAVGAGVGSQAFTEACVSRFPERASYRGLCPVDSETASSRVRDTHNWALTIVRYQGIAGLLFFMMACISCFRLARKNPYSPAPGTILLILLIAGSTEVIFSSPYGAVPATFALSWMASLGLTNSSKP